jgi:hypothetical protein
MKLMNTVRPFARYDVEAVIPARRYRSWPRSALDWTNKVLSPCRLKSVLRTGASFRRRRMAELHTCFRAVLADETPQARTGGQPTGAGRRAAGVELFIKR